jgi:erythromycin esterase-like protein
MPIAANHRAVQAIRDNAVPFSDDGGADALLQMVGDARFVLLGEASHGTHEFYDARARITRRLITEKGFQAVAVEGDWPDAYRVNRHVRGLGGDRDAAAALSGFMRFPRWMWRNRVVAAFIDDLRELNATRDPARQVGFYGLDLYSMNSSMSAVLDHLQTEDPETAGFVRERYACFEQFGPDREVYGVMTGMRGLQSCEAAVRQALRQVLDRAAAARRDGGTEPADAESEFNAAQNALLVKNAEAYYRSMYLSEESSWNVRDRHMAESLALLDEHLARQPGAGGQPPKIVVWAHNSHLGDARATEMGEARGELNLGQLVREQHGDEAFLVGFSTHAGTVTAADNWGAPARRMGVLPSRPESHEALMHASGIERFVLPLRGRPACRDALAGPRLERAIGVIYRPETERWSHYFSARLCDQFDALVHFDETRAVEALEAGGGSIGPEAPETYPEGT